MPSSPIKASAVCGCGCTGAEHTREAPHACRSPGCPCRGFLAEDGQMNADLAVPQGASGRPPSMGVRAGARSINVAGGAGTPDRLVEVRYRQRPPGPGLGQGLGRAGLGQGMDCDIIAGGKPHR